MMMNQEEEETLMINISGHRFETLPKTLEKFPETLLGSQRREVFFNHLTKEYFFDRDPDIFRHILNFYRTGNLHFPIDECISSYIEELRFFGIPCQLISDCCSQRFFISKRQNEERLLSIKSSLNLNEPSTLRKKLWKAFEYPRSSTRAMILYCVIALFIILPVLSKVVATLPCGIRPGRAGTLSCGERYKVIFFLIELAAIILYSIEYLIRLFAAPSRLHFIINLLAIIDIYVIGSFLASLWFNYYSFTIIIRVLRLYSIFNYSDQSQSSSVFRKTLKYMKSEIVFLICTLVTVTIIFAAGLFRAEKDVDGTNFTSIPAACWFTIGRMTMTGNGNMVPETISGKIISCACSISGFVIFAAFISVTVAKYIRIYLHQYQRFDKDKTSPKHHSV